jgi:hypothetical protein
LTQVLATRIEGAGDIDAIGRFPGDAAIFAVEDDPRDRFNPAEVESEPYAFQGVGGHIEGGAVGGGAGVVFHQRIGVLRPGLQAVE